MTPLESSPSLHRLSSGDGRNCCGSDSDSSVEISSNGQTQRHRRPDQHQDTVHEYSTLDHEHVANSANSQTAQQQLAATIGYDSADPRYSSPPAPGRRVYCPKTGIIYELCEQIGFGAAAVVFKARKVLAAGNGVPEHLDDSTEFAAKVISLRGLKLRSDFQREREKLRREVSILSRLHHPCIVNLLHVIEGRDELFLIMELVKEGELFFKIEKRGALTEDQARYALLQILYALEYMHSKGVIHRDLKPENILVASEPYEGFFMVKVADFGLAKLVRHGVSEAKTFVGTPQYWAPEVIDSSTMNHAYGPEADLWSLGCVIYVMLGGSYPFDTRRGPIDALIRNAQYHFGYPRFRTVSDDAKNVIRSLLTVDPKARMTVSQILEHPWITSYRIPPKVPPLPNFTSLTSKDYEKSLTIATRSVLAPTTSFSLEPFIHRPIRTKFPDLKRNILSPKAFDQRRKQHRNNFDQSVVRAAKLDSRDQPRPNQRPMMGKLEIDERFKDSVFRLAREETRERAFIQTRHHETRDRPDDPNSRAIVPAYQPWHPYPYYGAAAAAAYPPFIPPYQPATYMQSNMPLYGFHPPANWYPGQFQQPSDVTFNTNQPPLNEQQMESKEYGSPSEEDWQDNDVTSQSDSCSSHLALDSHKHAYLTQIENSPPERQIPHTTLAPMFSNNDDRDLPVSQEFPAGVVQGNKKNSPPQKFRSSRRELPDSDKNHCVVEKGLTTSPRTKREETVRTAELIFNFDELLELQIYIIRKFHWAYIALRRCPNTLKLVRTAIREVEDVQNESMQVIRQFEATCSSVLGVLPDLALSVTQRQPQLAIDLFEDIRGWVNISKSMVEKHQTRLAGFIQHVAALVEDIRHIKITTDQKFLRASLNLASICDDGRTDSTESCPRVHSVDSAATRTKSNGSRTSTTEIISGPTEMNDDHHIDTTDRYIKMTLATNPHDPGSAMGQHRQDGNIQQWYDDVRHTVQGQLESLVGKTIDDMRIDANAQVETCDATEITRIANDLLDLLFISPDSWAERHRVLANRKCIKEGNFNHSPHQQRRHSSFNYKKRHLPRASAKACPGISYENLHRSRSHSNLNSTRPGSDCSDVDNDEKHQQCHNIFATTSATDDAESIHPSAGEEFIEKRYSVRWKRQQERQMQRYVRQELYGQALKTSEILVKALDEVRRVDQILRQSAQFWINFTLMIDRLCKMKTHTERLLQYSCSNVQFAKRFFERLSDYKSFWTALRDRSRRYVIKAEAKMLALSEFALALESTADRADTANALHLGQSAAIIR